MGRADVPKLRLRPRARLDIAGIWAFTADRWSVDQAERYISGLYLCLEEILEFPKTARERVEFSPPVRIKHYSSHLIVYRIEPEWIEVIRIFHGSSDWQATLTGGT